MAAVDRPVCLVSKDEKVTTTVEFLWEVHRKGFQDEMNLRNYLCNKHELTKAQVDESFRIHQSKLDLEAKSNGEVNLNNQDQQKIRSEGNRERPETIREGSSIVPGALTFLLKEHWAVGEKLFVDFLKSENTYCSMLACLQFDYNVELLRLADQRKIDMTQSEVQEIFSPVQDLLNFHQSKFFAQLSQGADIAITYLRFFKTFAGYADYMKSCTHTVKIIRLHSEDKRLYKQMQRIKLSSKRKTDDMVDLLLHPLDRISEYRNFLTKLENWADPSQKDKYELISKAARRMKRVSQYIEKYKHSILNKSEMNKVQLFLNKQCNIFAPERRILRRGMMVRRTVGWASRNKVYIFFLFSDVFLWTTKSGELQNVVMLRDCEVFDSDTKTNPECKLKVVSSGRKNKVLLLECKTKRQRDDWFEAIKEAINTATEAQALNQEKLQQQGEKPANDEDVPTIMLKRLINRSIDLGTSPSRRISREFRLGDYGTQADLGTPLSDDTSFDNVFEYSRNFQIQELKDFEPFDDMSVSEYDNHLYAYDDDKGEAIKNDLNPFWKKSSNTGTDRSERKIKRVKTMEEQSGLKLITEELEKETDEDEIEDSDHLSDMASLLDKQEDFSRQPKPPKLNIIRGSTNHDAKRSPECTARLEHVSNITIRLNDLNG